MSAKRPDKLGWPLIGRYLCHQCMGYFMDGRQDCKTPRCPLYSKMPYRKLEPDMSFLAYNPKKKGLQDWEGNTLAGDTYRGFRVIAAAAPDDDETEVEETVETADDWATTVDGTPVEGLVEDTENWDDWAAEPATDPLSWD